MKRRIGLIITLGIFLSVGAFFSKKAYIILKETSREKAIWHSLTETINNEVADFKGDVSVLIKDLERGWEVTYNADQLFASASLAKIPILAACFYAQEEGKLDFNQIIKLQSKDKVSGSGELKGFSSGRKFSIEQLIDYMIVNSDNTATNILIDRLGFDYLNNICKRLELNNTNISRKMMDFVSRKNGIENYITSRDLLLILEQIYKLELVNQKASLKSLELLKRQEFRSRIPGELPSDTIVANKTGLERGICHDVGIVFGEKGDFFICVLTKHKNQTSTLSRIFISKLARLTYEYYQDL